MKAIEFDELEIDAKNIGELLATADATQAIAKCRQFALQSFRDNFTSSASAEGEAWVPRKVPGDGHPLLMDTGALLQAATGGGSGHVTRTEPRSLELGVDKSVKQGGIPGAGAHQFGYPPNNLPPRPFLDVAEQQLARCDAAIGEHFDKQLEGRP